jgi:hypothetical protein
VEGEEGVCIRSDVVSDEVRSNQGQYGIQ